MKTMAQLLTASYPVMPVLVIPTLESAVPLAKALAKGGAKVIEVTLRTPCSMAAIKAIKAALPELIIGAGSVTTIEQAREVKAAGASFAVSPGFLPELIQAAQAEQLPFLPGVMTPSEVLAAKAAGLDCVKLFPAELAGGTAMLKALSGPLAEMAFCPTGGVSESNCKAYLQLDNVRCVGGSWVAPMDVVERGDWALIETLMRTASQLAP